MTFYAWLSQISSVSRLRWAIVFVVLSSLVTCAQAAPSEANDDDADAPQANLYIYPDESGGATAGIIFSPQLGQTPELLQPLGQAIGSPLRPLQERHGKWATLGYCDHIGQRVGLLTQEHFDLAPLLPALRQLHVGWLMIIVKMPELPVTHYPGAQPWGNRDDSKSRYAYRSVWLDDVKTATPSITFSFGYTARQAFNRLSPLVLALIVPLALTLWARGRALRAKRGASLEPAVVWFGYMRFLQWVGIGTWIGWFGTITAAQAGTLGEYLWGGYPLMRAAGVPFMLFYALPAIVIVSCYALSYPVFREVRGSAWSRADLVRQAAWGQARMLPIMCFVIGLNSLSSEPRLSMVWLMLGWMSRSLVAQATMRAMGMTPHALTVGELRDRVFALAAEAKVKVQQVYVLPSGPGRIANAFAASGNRVMLTDFLLQHLSKREVDAVIAHELTHLQRRHTFALPLMFWPLGIVAVVGSHVAQDRTASPLVAGLAYGALFMLGLFGAYFLMRRFERAADAGALRLTGDAEACITGLTKLARLNMTPLEWGRGHESWITHPSMMRRFEAIAQLAGLPPIQLQALLARDAALTDTATPTTEPHYEVPSALTPELLFSSIRKSQFSQGSLWLLLAVTTGVPALVAVGARAAAWQGATLWLAYGMGVVLAIGLQEVLVDMRNARFYSKLEQRLRVKLQAENVDLAGGIFVGFAPAATPRLYENFYDWDIGFITLSENGLCYVGEQTRFCLRREQITRLELRADTPGWWRWSRLYLTWQVDAAPGEPPNVDASPQQGTFNLRPGANGTRWQSRRAAQDLLARLQAWQATPSSATPTTLPWGAPALGAVTSQSPRQLARLGLFITHLALRVPVALGVSVLAGLSFDASVTGTAWYVMGTSLVCILWSLLPYWRYREAPANGVKPQPGL